jgi:hypothetical protein
VIEAESMFKYFPHTEEDRRAMAERIGIRSEAELFRDIPKDVLFRRDYDLPSAQSEIELRKTLADLEAQNAPKICFGGMGVYDHYAPAVLSQLTSRQEFQTAYTPYQPEVAQGTLQYIFEFQSMITMLTEWKLPMLRCTTGPPLVPKQCSWPRESPVGIRFWYPPPFLRMSGPFCRHMLISKACAWKSSRKKKELPIGTIWTGF